MLKTIQTFATDLGNDEGGTALLEYTILLGIISLATITAALAIGGWIGPKWTTFCAKLTGLACT